MTLNTIMIEYQIQTFFKKSKDSKYMRDLIGGTLGRVLGEQNPIMYEAIKHSDNWAVIRGREITEY